MIIGRRRKLIIKLNKKSELILIIIINIRIYIYIFIHILKLRKRPMNRYKLIKPL